YLFPPLLLRPSHGPPPFPYTTLFRSRREPLAAGPLPSLGPRGVFSHPADLRRGDRGARHRRSPDGRPVARLPRRRRGHRPHGALTVQSAMPTKPAHRLEAVPNPHPDRAHEVAVAVPEFTCMW